MDETLEESVQKQTTEGAAKAEQTAEESPEQKLDKTVTQLTEEQAIEQGYATVTDLSVRFGKSVGSIKKYITGKTVEGVLFGNNGYIHPEGVKLLELGFEYSVDKVVDRLCKVAPISPSVFRKWDVEVPFLKRIEIGKTSKVYCPPETEYRFKALLQYMKPRDMTKKELKHVVKDSDEKFEAYIKKFSDKPENKPESKLPQYDPKSAYNEGDVIVHPALGKVKVMGVMQRRIKVKILKDDSEIELVAETSSVYGAYDK